MGIVFLAEDPQLKRPVALKAMKPSLAASDSARKRFVQEAQATAAIAHDHIVHIYQVGEDRWLVVSADGHYRGPPQVEEEPVYVVQTDKGQHTLTPEEFAQKYGWKNDPERVRLTGQ